jgi:uncharacterized protein
MRSDARPRFLVRLAPRGDGGEAFLSKLKAVSSHLGVKAASPRWNSRGALEVDLFPRSGADVDLLLAVLEPMARVEVSKDLMAPPPHRSPSEAGAEARALFNDERYWECHEALEGVWRTMAGPGRSYVQGVILVAAAFVHHQKGEDDVALSILRRARPQLGSGSPDWLGVDERSLLRQLERAIAARDLAPFEV